LFDSFINSAKVCLIYNNIGSETIWIGVDDTDSRKGGCTTHVAQAIIEKLTEENYSIVGYPRLVRLNPNIPWKTRGNGAISIQVRNGKQNKIRRILEEILDKYARIDDKQTNPGFVILQEQPLFNIYERAAREIVPLKEIKQLLDSLGAEYKGYKNSRGLVGATASVAWSPKYDKTYELIAYREERRWGTKRQVDSKSVKKMDEAYVSTFDNYDYENSHNRLVPNSPCPVLYGIRGDNAEDLIQASAVINSEKVDRWMIFETNQGTDDHLQKKSISEIQPYQSVISKGVVCMVPHTIEGGHVIFTIKNSTGVIDCAAYEPTKQFRRVVRELRVGDVIEVHGGVRERPLTINIEKINIIYLTKQVEKVENPICPKCGKHMKSKGTNQGYKCKICGLKNEKPMLREKKRKISTGFYEVPVCARRHLSKPLKRMIEP
jgi:tRNA(Ile2)-agmatinylcytidine synthase